MRHVFIKPLFPAEAFKFAKAELAVGPLEPRARNAATPPQFFSVTGARRKSRETPR